MALAGHFVAGVGGAEILVVTDLGVERASRLRDASGGDTSVIASADNRSCAALAIGSVAESFGTLVGRGARSQFVDASASVTIARVGSAWVVVIAIIAAALAVSVANTAVI